MIKKKAEIITDKFITTVCKRLAENKQVRRSLPIWGRIHIDRQLPFLCVYRRPKEHENLMSERLIMGEASYLIASRNRYQQKQLSLLIKKVAFTLKEVFGSFLIIEIWTANSPDEKNELNNEYQPNFKIIKTNRTAIFSTIDTLENNLQKIKIRKLSGEVIVDSMTRIAPKNLPPLISQSEAKQMGIHLVGIEVNPIYFDKQTGQVFPLIRRELSRGFTRALNNSFFEFTHNHTAFRPKHYQSLGRWSMVKAVWEVDQKLAEISNDFDFLLQVTPINGNSAWSAFQKSHFEKIPEFIYRPLPLDPVISKRRLFGIPIEKIEDPTLASLFREQQIEMDRKFTMLIDRDTLRFLYGSIQLYGKVDNPLKNTANDILEKLSSRSRDESHKSKINASAFAAIAEEELNYFRKILPEHNSKVFLRDDITGLMVSQGNLLIGSQTKISQPRIQALIQHEIGTHVLTYLNGIAQPFKQLYIGLSGYEELQEGLAVLSEYLVGGLTSRRLRLLAARVIAAHFMIDGASLVDVFRELNKNHGFERRTAFNICMRTFRGGGLTKDIVYLRGLIQLLKYLKNGGELEQLFVGKIFFEHIAIIKELQWRKVLSSAPLRPRYLNNPETANKLIDLRKGLSPINLIERSK